MAITLINPYKAEPAQPAPPVTSLRSKVITVALAVFVAVGVGAGAFLISSSLPVSLAAGIITLLLLYAWIYYLNRNTPPPVEVVPPLVEDPVIPEIPLAPVPEIPKHDGNTPLHSACLRHDVETMQRLIDEGAITDARNEKDQTPWNLIDLGYDEARALFTDTAPALEKDSFEKTKQKAKDILIYAEASPSLRREMDLDRRLIDKQRKLLETGLW